MSKPNDQPPILAKCECTDCSCQSATAKPAPDVTAVCSHCFVGQHRTDRVKALERALDNAREEIKNLQRITRRM